MQSSNWVRPRLTKALPWSTYGFQGPLGIGNLIGRWERKERALRQQTHFLS